MKSDGGLKVDSDIRLLSVFKSGLPRAFQHFESTTIVDYGYEMCFMISNDYRFAWNGAVVPKTLYHKIICLVLIMWDD